MVPKHWEFEWFSHNTLTDIQAHSIGALSDVFTFKFYRSHKPPPPLWADDDTPQHTLRLHFTSTIYACQPSERYHHISRVTDSLSLKSVNCTQRCQIRGPSSNNIIGRHILYQGNPLISWGELIWSRPNKSTVKNIAIDLSFLIETSPHTKGHSKYWIRAQCSLLRSRQRYEY